MESRIISRILPLSLPLLGKGEGVCVKPDKALHHSILDSTGTPTHSPLKTKGEMQKDAI